MKQIGQKIDTVFRGKLQRSSKVRDAWDNAPGEIIKHLSLALCGQIASYYRLAVQRHSGIVPAIIEAIKAIPLHLSANDLNAENNHRFCPYSASSWRIYQAAKYTNGTIPSHLHYLGDEATALIFELFEDFGYDSPEFIEKISEGRTSNHNEAIHSVLFSMVPKSHPVGIDVMNLVSDLAIVRYNEGYEGIEHLFSKLDIGIYERLCCDFNYLDNTLARHHSQLIRRPRKRYRKKQNRGRTTRKQIAKHGVGYKPGRYSAATSSNPDKLPSSEDESEPKIASPLLSSVECCHVCKGTERTALWGLSLGLRIIEEELDWVQCENCDRWYHLLCLNIDDHDDIGDTWVCEIC